MLDARFLPESNRHWHDDCLRTVYTRTTSSLPASSNKSCAIHAMEPGKQSLKSSEPSHTATHWWSMMPGCSLSAGFSSARDRSLTLNGEDEAKGRARGSGDRSARTYIHNHYTYRGSSSSQTSLSAPEICVRVCGVSLSVRSAVCMLCVYRPVRNENDTYSKLYLSVRSKAESAVSFPEHTESSHRPNTRDR